MRFEFDEAHARVVLQGAVNEESDFKPVVERIAGRRVRLDLSQVKRINSAGVVRWLDFVQRLPVGTQVVLERCAVGFVERMNMLPSLTEGVQVDSVLVPVQCSECRTPREDEFPVSAILDDALPEPAPCERCGGRVEIDALTASYFAFARA